MIRNLVISGGGIKIIAIIGVIKYLEENNLLSNSIMPRPKTPPFLKNKNIEKIIKKITYRM